MSSFFGEAEGGIFAPNQDPLSRFLFEPPLKRSVSSFLFEQGSVAHHLHITHQRTCSKTKNNTIAMTMSTVRYVQAATNGTVINLGDIISLRGD